MWSQRGPDPRNFSSGSDSLPVRAPTATNMAKCVVLYTYHAIRMLVNMHRPYAQELAFSIVSKVGESASAETTPTGHACEVFVEDSTR